MRLPLFKSCSVPCVRIDVPLNHLNKCYQPAYHKNGFDIDALARHIAGFSQDRPLHSRKPDPEFVRKAKERREFASDESIEKDYLVARALSFLSLVAMMDVFPIDDIANIWDRAASQIRTTTGQFFFSGYKQGVREIEGSFIPDGTHILYGPAKVLVIAQEKIIKHEGKEAASTKIYFGSRNAIKSLPEGSNLPWSTTRGIVDYTQMTLLGVDGFERIRTRNAELCFSTDI